MKKKTILILYMVIASFMPMIGATHLPIPWSHHGFNSPTEWGASYQNCNGEEQSPINIVTSEVNDVTGEMPNLMFKYEGLPSNMILGNSGHLVVMTFPGYDDYELSGGPFGLDRYKPVQLHFHWGDTNRHGSEHSIDGFYFPMEMHVVHYNLKFGSMQEALSMDDGVVVLASFLEVVPDEMLRNDAIEAIVDKLWALHYSGDTAKISVPFPLSQLLPVDKSYYYYHGSLTIPDCNEIVQWLLLKEPLKISEAQINEFRSLYDDHDQTLSNNFRPPQPINSRMVFMSNEG